MLFPFFQERPRLVVAVGVSFTSLSSILIRFSAAPPLVIAAYRLVFTVLLVTPLYLRERRLRPGGASERRDTRPRRREFLLSAVSGAFLALHFGLWITSLSYTSVANSTVLVSTHPIVVAIASALFLRDPIRKRSIPFMLTAVAGSVLLVAGDRGTANSSSIGDLLAFLGAVSVGGYIIIGRVVRERLSVNEYTMIVYPVSAILLSIGAIVSGASLGPYPVREFALFLALALFCTVLGHSLYSWALRFVRPTFVSTSTLGEPVLASALAAIVFGEIPTLHSLAGATVILVSIFLFVRTETRAATGEPRTEAEDPEAPSP